MKKVLSLLLLVVVLLSFTACGEEAFKIPDVFGINYTDAIGILEAEGFEVNAVETSVGSISEKLLYPLETVEKGAVFKIDDYILDGNGYLNKDYDVYYEGELTSEDKNLVIYYAKEDYSKESNSTTSKDTQKDTTEVVSENKSTTATNNNNSIDPEFKQAMDSYEKFMGEYVAFMKKYTANPTDMSLLADYTNYMSKYTEMVKDFEKWENEDMNSAELAYYVDVQGRVAKKLLEVAQ